MNLTRYRRERIEDLIEVPVGMLDAADEDDDREVCADEPLVWGVDDAVGDPGDAEDSHDAEDDCDDEATAQPATTPYASRPTAPAVWL